jgi:hypothetical protein
MDKKEIKKQIEQIKKEVDEKLKDTIYWFKINCKKTKILVKGNSKTETRKKIKEIAENNKLEYAIIFRVIVHVHKELIFDKAIISFNFDNFQILDGKLKKIHINNSEGGLWLTKDWLIENGWDNQYIFNAVEIIKNKEGKILIPGIGYYHLLGKN